jgi:hypothetical protein
MPAPGGSSSLTHRANVQPPDGGKRDTAFGEADRPEEDGFESIGTTGTAWTQND